MSEIDIRVEGFAGRITLNRPQVLNALSYTQIQKMIPALRAWATDPAVKLVVIDAVGGKSFCSGGDIQAIYRDGKTRPQDGRTFWREEYAMNAFIRHYPKPYVALMDGFVIGGGIGISALGSHRIVTEKSMVLMPETSIGFMPDVGGTRILADAPGYTGFYLGITSMRMNAADAIYAGFADSFVPLAALPELSAALNDGDVKVIAQFAQSPHHSKLAEHRTLIDQHFSKASLLEILASLEAGSSDWEMETLAALRRVSPFAACATFAALTQLRKTRDIESALTLEFRYAYRSLEGTDFYEGIRAAVIDKDKSPKWNPARIEDVDPASVAAVLSTLGEQEWRNIL